MYYVLGKDLKAAKQFAYFEDDPEGYDSDFWTSGEAASKQPPHLTLTARDGQTELSDLLLTSCDMLVFSPKLKKIFDGLKTESIVYYPVTVVTSDGKRDESYRAAHIVTRVNCLDAENSECMKSASDGGFLSVDEFSIFEDRIPPQSNGAKPPIFRLGEFEYHVLVDETVKDLCEKAGITGAKFTKPEDYV
jgi:hypothetical protein